MIRRRIVLFLLLVPLVLVLAAVVQQQYWQRSARNFDWSIEFNGLLNDMLVDDSNDRIYILVGESRQNPVSLERRYHAILHCLDFNGNPIWTQKDAAPPPSYWDMNILEPTLLLEGSTIHILCGINRRFCLDGNGELLWQVRQEDLMLMEDLPGGQASYVVDVYGTLYGIDRLGQPCWRSELVPEDYHYSAFHHAEPDGSFTVVTNSWVNNPSDHSRSVKRMFRVSCTGELISEDELNGNVIVSDRMHMFADGSLVNLPDPYRGPANGIRIAGQPFDRDQWMHEIKPEAGDTKAARVQDDRLYWLIDHLWELDSNGRFRSLSGSGCLDWDISESGVRLLAYPDPSPMQRMGMPEELCMPETLKMHCRVPGRLFPVVRRFRADLANQRDIKLAASNELMLFGNNISTTPFKCKVNCSLLKK